MQKNSMSSKENKGENQAKVSWLSETSYSASKKCQIILAYQ